MKTCKLCGKELNTLDARVLYCPDCQSDRKALFLYYNGVQKIVKEVPNELREHIPDVMRTYIHLLKKYELSFYHSRKTLVYAIMTHLNQCYSWDIHRQTFKRMFNFEGTRGLRQGNKYYKRLKGCGAFPSVFELENTFLPRIEWERIKNE